MEGFEHPSDADREFDELRARAYGPDPDIAVDPPALARLRELEAAQRADGERRADAAAGARPAGSAARSASPFSRDPPVRQDFPSAPDPPVRQGFPSAPDPPVRQDFPSAPDPPVRPDRPTAAASPSRPDDLSTACDEVDPSDQPASPDPPASSAPPAPPAGHGSSLSFLRRVTATWRRRLAWTVGVLVVLAGIVITLSLASAPRPDASLQATGDEADDRVRELVVEDAPWLEIDVSTLRAFGTYRGLEIWSAVNAFESPCLVAMHRANDVLSEWRCAPAAAELIMDVSSSGDGFEGFDGLDGDGIIRFLLRGDTVDAYVHLMPEAD